MLSLLFFFFNDTATTEIYTLSLHDALPIYVRRISGKRFLFGGWRKLEIDGGELRKAMPVARPGGGLGTGRIGKGRASERQREPDRKSTRLNSSHSQNSYSGVCLQKQKDLDY